MDNEIARKKCAQCGEPIVGVIPKYKDGEPLCRNCTFNYARPQAKAQRESSGEGRGLKARAAQGGAGRRYLWAIPVLLAMVAAFVAIRLVSSGSFRDEPLRRGAVKTDRIGDECIQNLWLLSKAMQEGKLKGLALTCPASKRPYDVREVLGDTVVNCPTPAAHKLTALKVSRSNPIPVAVR